MKTFLVLVAVLASAFAECPSGWTAHPGGQRCFLAVNSFKTYDNARSYCSSTYGGFLATINDATDTTACLAATKWGSSNQFWFGLKQNYVWDEGKALSTLYTNWKSGSVLTTCNTFEGISGKWTAGDLCTKLLPFICEVPAMITCPFEKLIVSKNAPLVLETIGASNQQTVSNYNCTKEISVAPDVDINQNLHIRIKMYSSVSGSANILVTDPGNTPATVAVFGNPDKWHDLEFNTYRRKVWIVAYATTKGRLGYRIEFSTLSGKCPKHLPFDHFNLFDNGTRCYSFAVNGGFLDGQKECRKYGGHVATIRSMNDYPAFRYAQNCYSDYYTTLIGLHKNATTKSYVWDDGSTVGFTNWKTGPSSAVTDCVGNEYDTSKWVSGKSCNDSSSSLYVCETKAMRVYPFNKYQVSKGWMVSWETDSASMGKTVTAYNSTFEVSVVNKATETVLVKIKHYANTNYDYMVGQTGVAVKDAATRKYIQYHGSTSGQWNYVEYDTKSSAIRVEVIADIIDELGAVMYFEGKTI